MTEREQDTGESQPSEPDSTDPISIDANVIDFMMYFGALHVSKLDCELDAPARRYFAVVVPDSAEDVIEVAQYIKPDADKVIGVYFFPPQMTSSVERAVLDLRETSDLNSAQVENRLGVSMETLAYGSVFIHPTSNFSK